MRRRHYLLHVDWGWAGLPPCLLTSWFPRQVSLFIFQEPHYLLVHSRSSVPEQSFVPSRWGGVCFGRGVPSRRESCNVLDDRLA